MQHRIGFRLISYFRTSCLILLSLLIMEGAWRSILYLCCYIRGRRFLLWHFQINDPWPSIYSCPQMAHHRRHPRSPRNRPCPLHAPQTSTIYHHHLLLCLLHPHLQLLELCPLWSLCQLQDKFHLNLLPYPYYHTDRPCVLYGDNVLCITYETKL